MTFLRKYRELLLGLSMLLIGIIYIIATTRIQIRIPTRIDARFVPYLLGFACLLLGLWQSAAALRMIRKEKGKEAEKVERSDPKSVVLTFLLIVAYIVTLRSVGFLLNTAWMMFLMMMLLCPRDKWRFGQFAFISVVTSVVIYFLFRNGLELMLPDGILG
jgi:putative tricarboxylic transport membrane protein